MATFMEQIAYAERWVEPGGPGEQAPTDGSVGPTSSGKPAESPRVRRQVLLTSIVEAEILPRLARLRQSMPAPMGSDRLVAKSLGGGRALAGDAGFPAMAGDAGFPAMAGDAGGRAMAGDAGGRAMARDGGAAAGSTDEDTARLVHLLLTEEASGAMTFIDLLRQRGRSLTSICLGVVTDAARRLGAMWDDDLCDFVQVSISMGRLQQVLRGLSPLFQTGSPRRSRPESLLLAPAPGEQHTFGLMMLAEFFRVEGWLVAGGPRTSEADAIAIVRAGWIDVAGFSIGSNGRVEALAHSITAVRRASRNPNLFVMVGGPLILSKPDLVLRVGADLAAIDAAGAVRQARGLLSDRMAAN